MRIRTIRHFVLYFAVGLSWGYVGKTIVNHYFYVGYGDPQVLYDARNYSVERLIQKLPQEAEASSLEPIRQRSDDKQPAASGTVSI